MAKATKLHVRKGDTVMVITGKDAGKKGKVLVALPKEGKVVVEGVAMVTRHQKPRKQGEPGGRIDQEAAIHASNVMLFDSQANRPTRVGYKTTDDGKKVRVSKVSGQVLDK